MAGTARDALVTRESLVVEQPATLNDQLARHRAAVGDGHIEVQPERRRRQCPPGRRQKHHQGSHEARGFDSHSAHSAASLTIACWAIAWVRSGLRQELRSEPDTRASDLVSGSIEGCSPPHLATARWLLLVAWPGRKFSIRRTSKLGAFDGAYTICHVFGLKRKAEMALASILPGVADRPRPE